MIKNHFQIQRLKKILAKVKSFESEMAGLTDAELRKKTQEFKERLAAGETLDDLLPEAYAVVREADKRVLGMFPYDVQVMGAIVLHEGNVAEMATGEGKTLTATMPLYLNALSGQGAMLVTTNTYLALRDAQEMGQVYRFLGLTIEAAVVADETENLTPKQKRLIYQADIVYTTNSALGFDYLIENLAENKDSQYLSPFNYVIIDEIDSILLDSAQVPLVISGAPRVQSNFYSIMDTFITTLKEEEDYHYDDEKNEVWLTSKGILAAESFLDLEHLFSKENQELVRHLNLALRAHKLYKKDKDYVVRQGDKEAEVVLLDRATGRLLEMTRLQGGQHQAIEAKEHVKLTEETRAMASITYQNLFRLFRKISGMTGTGKVVESEFMETYSMSVIKIPTNQPVIRQDLPDQLYQTLPEKVFASLDEVKHYHAQGNPLLIFTGSVEMSEIYSSLLLREGIAHNLLNANNAAREAQIIAESGQKGAVTVATSMAGRGTDIKLGPGVADLGGLVVIGTERMENQRIDLQIRGRSGRQGDPGISKFFISLEDDLLRKWGPDWLKKLYKDYSTEEVQQHPVQLGQRRFRRLVAKAQRASESSAKMSRRMTLEYAQCMKIQREITYAERNRLIQAEERIDEEISRVLSQVIHQAAYEQSYETRADLYRFILDHFSYHAERIPYDFDIYSPEKIAELLQDIAEQELQAKKAYLKSDKLFTHFQRVSVLKAIDENWVEQVDYLQQLKTALSGQHFSMKNPLVEYYQEAYDGFEYMKERMKQQIVKNLLMSELALNPKGEVIMYFP
ncbi:SecA-like protein, putative [Streptococcus sanguinis SK36]|jgi:accessory sec system translocase secA2|uniref:Protein translocase subunit SecA 2 n=1 Tax=Streptococcus sanguinis (strain SK36) TaxID=388919 RepID=SECA2_STRSV|nr:accessory Sec system translocase SecA2 [Streptococcus sanguinis]A3CM59.1 RecName: Full=Protein translocase subunit SecA 2 [Streptococcus sanguinis SK36]MBF1698487.1 accessory Sec system translocase SecA2 [Streptococcus cristatus]ABN44264.1 SecA-like protein, putative [Streptococcus sanguinis SK36]MBZ2054342.1 accessory Sec system translocase SecA2 [Streptococcus sanguinis]RSI38753.1 preprotein translocase subunit SecA [Streptococcus sanguinis]